MWTLEESLTYKVHNRLADRAYQREKNCHGNLQPLSSIKKTFKKLTNHVTLEACIEKDFFGDYTTGYKCTIANALADGIRSGEFEFDLSKVNELKISGDGGCLCRNCPMVVLFLQSLMKKTDRQGVRGCLPLAIATTREEYDNLSGISGSFSQEIETLEANGMKVGGKVYRIKFYFASDLKFLCPYCLANFATTAHKTNCWPIMRHVEDGRLRTNEVGEKYIKEKRIAEGDFGVVDDCLFPIPLD